MADTKKTYETERNALLDELSVLGIKDKRVLDQIGSVPRHALVPVQDRHLAYRNRPLPIGHGQTISQPYIVALMSEVLEPAPSDKVLEIGTGSAYQALVLSGLVDQVYTIEIQEKLGLKAKETIDAMGYQNIHVRIGDGYQGWPEEAPFDKIIVTAAPPEIPEALISQLKEGGRMVIPVGQDFQELLLVQKDSNGITTKKIAPVRFVPMVEK
jgi:protein-L-isoaspartate(D-aspartate) O-methyltransferase